MTKQSAFKVRGYIFLPQLLSRKAKLITHHDKFIQKHAVQTTDIVVIGLCDCITRKLGVWGRSPQPLSDSLLF